MPGDAGSSGCTSLDLMAKVRKYPLDCLLQSFSEDPAS